jgi:BirA family biotin operon repressor/biotin-[acetyl-CoA-carboxylase] ligase
MPGDRSAGAWAAAVSSSVVQGVLRDNRVVRRLHHVAEVDSTQDVLRRLASDGAAHGTVLVADLQRSGRGRSGHRWDDDPAGGNLALSLLLDVEAPPLIGSTAPILPHVLGLAVVDACATIASSTAELRIKWPNDVVHRSAPAAPSRKLAGVLVERERLMREEGPRDVLVCGIGINVDLDGSAPADRVDLATLAGENPDRIGLLGALLGALDDTIGLLAAPAEVLERSRRVSDTLGRVVRVEVPGHGPLIGVATGIDDAGRLLVTAGGVTHAILSGTVRDADVHERASPVANERQEQR